ncbi:MAG TPA: hypothetical protein VHQ86_02450 [Candidatus Saccharimonadia bacterium]|jgi:cobalamin biosynthesis Mg chelatase CobN|nr:hypothetical protein [Candidatus Saccharimonadia bacterium]
MLKRLFMIAVFALVPLAAAADEAPASALGPQISAPSGGSTGDASALQPATSGPQQPDTSASSGLTAPVGGILQQPATGNDALKVLAGEADGSPHDQSDDGGLSFVDALIIAAVIVLIGCVVAVVVRDRRRFRATEPFAH